MPQNGAGAWIPNREEAAPKCGICLSSDYETMFQLECGHGGEGQDPMHLTCLGEWVKGGGKTCPVCRKAIDTQTMDMLKEATEANQEVEEEAEENEEEEEQEQIQDDDMMFPMDPL